MIRKKLYLYTISNGEKVLFPIGQEPAVLDDWEYSANRMAGAPVITGTFMHKKCLDDMWDMNVFVEFNGERYYIRQIPTSSKDNTDLRYKHEVSFLSERYILENVLFMDVVTSNTDEQYKDRFRSNNTTFSFYGTLHEFVSRINDSLIYSGLYDTNTNEGYHAVIDEGITVEDTLELSFDNIYISSALQEGYSKFKIPYYWVGKTCHFGYTKNAILKPFEYGKSNGLLSITKENANNRLINRITGIGSSDNIPFYYPNENQYGEAVFSTKNIDKSLVSVSLKDIVSHNVDMYDTYTYCKNIDTVFEDISKYIYISIKKITSAETAFDIYSDTEIWCDFYNSEQKKNSNGKIFYRFYFRMKDFCLNFKIDGKKGSSIDITSFLHPLYTFPDNNINPIIVTDIRTWAEMQTSLLDKFKINNNYTFESDEEYILSIHYEGLSFYIDSENEFQDFYSYAVIFYNWYNCNIYYSLKNRVKYFFIYGKENENKVEYSKSGIAIKENDNASYATCTYKYESGNGVVGTIEPSTLQNAATIMVTGKKYITPSRNLVPPIYRDSLGAERFYNAENDTYVDENGEKYVFKNTYSKNNPMEGTTTFEHIKPTIKGIKNEAGQLFGEIAEVAFDDDDSDEVVKGGDSKENREFIHSYFYIKLHIFNGEYGFNLFKQALAEGAMTFNFTSGNCAGCSFEVGVSEPILVDDHYEFDNPVITDENGNLVKVQDTGDSGYTGDYIQKKGGEYTPRQQDTSTHEVWVALKKEDSTYGVVMPNVRENYKPNVGDTFVITNILMPRTYIINAENELKAAIIKYMSENNEEKFNFNITLSRIYLQENPDIAQLLDENARITVTYNGHDYTLYVSSYTCKVTKDLLAEISVSLTDELSTGKSALYEKITDVAQGLFTKSSLDVAIQGQRMFLSKLQDDIANGRITFNKLIKILGGAQFGDNYVHGETGVGGYIDENGNADFGDIYLRGIMTVISGMQSQNFKSGYNGQGLQILSKDSEGRSYIEADKLYIRMKAIFEQLEIREIQYIGGNFIFSPASGKISNVIENNEFYICFFKNDDGETKVDIQFKEGDLVLCKTSNISEAGNYEGVSNRYYWRKCMAVSYDDGCIYLSKKYIDNSRDNDAPKAGDNVVTLGNDTDKSRQNAIIISVVGDSDSNFNTSAPSIVQYAGINDFSIIGKSVTKISPDGNEFTGSFKVTMSDGTETSLANWMEAEAGRISLSVGNSVNTAVENITISTRNLVSHGDVGVRGVTTYKVMDVHLTENMVHGGKYTLVMKATPSNTALGRKYSLVHPKGYGLGSGFAMPESGIASYTFKYVATDGYPLNKLIIYHAPNSSDLETNPVDIYWTCLYEGDGKVPMTFIPNVDDVDSKVTENTASINILSDSIEQRVTKTEFSALEIGGRNIVIGATNGNGLTGNGIYDAGTGVFSSSMSSGEFILRKTFRLGSNIVLNNGESYTLSFESKVEYALTCNVSIYDSKNNAIINKSFGVALIESNSWKRNTFHFNMEGSSDAKCYIQFSFSRNYSSQESSMQIRRIKLEKGDKATDFSPAPEDVSTYTETVVKQTAESFSIKLHQSTQSDNLLHNSSMLENMIQSTINGVVNVTPEKWEHKRNEGSSMVVSEGTGDLTGLYFTNAKNFEGLYQFASKNTNLSDLKDGDVLTVSFDLYRPDASLTRLCVWTEEQGYAGIKVDELAPVGAWTRLKYTYTYSSDTIRNFIVFNTSGSGTLVSFVIRNIKLEYGEFATGWCGSKEDEEQNRKAELLDTGIDIENKKITVTADKFLVQNNSGVPTAVFDGSGDKPLLKAENIDVENLEVKHLDGADGLFKGTLSIGSEQKIVITESKELPKSVRLDFINSSGENVAFMAFNGDNFYFTVFGNNGVTTISSIDGIMSTFSSFQNIKFQGKILTIGEDGIVRAQ